MWKLAIIISLLLIAGSETRTGTTAMAAPPTLDYYKSIVLSDGKMKVESNLVNISINDDPYSTEIYKNFTRHYYYVQILGTSKVNFNVLKSDVTKDFVGDHNIIIYPVIGKSRYLLEDVKIEYHPDYPLNDTILRIVNESRWVTTYNVSYPRTKIDTADTREYVIQFDSDNFVNGLFNISTPYGIVDPNVTACGGLQNADTTYTMNSSLTVGTGTCFTFNNTNQTFDCQGFTLTGGGSGTAWVSSVFKSTLQNCTVSSFTTNLFNFNGAHNATIQNVVKNSVDGGYALLQNQQNTTVRKSTFKTNSGTAGLSLVNVDFSTFKEVQVNSTGSQCLLFNTGSDKNVVEDMVVRCDGSRGFQVSGGSDGNVFNNLRILSTGTTALFIANGGNSYSNCVANATEVGNAVQFESGGGTNINFTNCTLFSHNSLAVHIGSAAGTDIIFRDNYIFANLTDSNPLILLSSATRVKFINNTIRQISQNRTLVKITGTSSGNTFELNRFGNTTDFYINVTSTGAGNSFNGSTFTGINQGNIYPDVENGSRNITGIDASSITGFNIGVNGSDYPYNVNTTNKVSGGATDFFPLVVSAVSSTCDCPAAGSWTISDGSQCTLSTTCNLGTNFFKLTSGSLDITATGRLKAALCVLGNTIGFSVDRLAGVSCG